MHYREMRDKACNGDVLLLEGHGWVGTLIRVLTGQSFSHVALLLWIDNGLWVAEMKELHGYRLMPASHWLENTMHGAHVYWGAAPDMVRTRHIVVKEEAFKYRNQRYSYISLFTVWLSQILRRKVASKLVCSTFVQRVWSACGFQFEQTPDPGDYLHLCSSVTRLAEE